MKNVFFSLSVFTILFFSCKPVPQTDNNGIEDETISFITTGLPVPFEDTTATKEEEVIEEKIVPGEEIIKEDLPNREKQVSDQIKIKEKAKVSTVKKKTIEPKPKIKEDSEPVVKEVTSEVRNEIVEAPIIKPNPPKSEPIINSSLDHSPFDTLLKKHVSVLGNVNYNGFKSDKRKLDEYVLHLEKFAPQRSWSSNKEMAYWINLYNAWTIKVVLENYPVKSIMDIDGGKTWNVKRVKSGQNTYSLDEVENAILRPKFKDARIHFAVNCAAKSCPSLWNRAWTEGNLQRQLETQTKKFINNSAYNTFSKKNAEISKIFEWYADDFGNIKDYLNKYLTTPLKNNTTVKYAEYDWALNM